LQREILTNSKGAAQMTTVMVPLDGSPAAEAALPWATFLAKQSDGTVHLVGVHAPPAVVLDGETLIGSVVPDDSIRERETAYFTNTQSQLEAAGVRATADLLDGSVITALLEYARRLKPDWIVMLSHARGVVARFFLGETAVEFVRQSPSPVLLVHPGNTSLEPIVSRVLVPLDGSPLAERILEPAANLARLAGTEVTLITALAAAPELQVSGIADAYLQQCAVGVRVGSGAVRCQVVSRGAAGDVILHEAKGHPGTVIALTTHGRGGLSKLVWGSVADHVIRHTQSPVLVFRPLEH
jgi:nucleotide-binding universal stress UspA family protein